MDTPKLVTFLDLLRQGHTVAQLANTVETEGVWGWDRYGRYGRFSHPTNSIGAVDALELLAAFHRFEQRLYEEADNFAEGGETLSVDPVNDLIEGWSGGGLDKFGWPAESLPRIDTSALYPSPPKRKGPSVVETSTLHLLGCLLVRLSDLRQTGKTMRIPSEDVLLGDMRQSFPNIKGLSNGTATAQFAAAKKMVLKANST
jgi:hypothetical protein